MLCKHCISLYPIVVAEPEPPEPPLFGWSRSQSRSERAAPAQAPAHKVKFFHSFFINLHGKIIVCSKLRARSRQKAGGFATLLLLGTGTHQ